MKYLLLLSMLISFKFISAQNVALYYSVDGVQESKILPFDNSVPSYTFSDIYIKVGSTFSIDSVVADNIKVNIIKYGRKVDGANQYAYPYDINNLSTQIEGEMYDLNIVSSIIQYYVKIFVTNTASIDNVSTETHQEIRIYDFNGKSIDEDDLIKIPAGYYIVIKGKSTKKIFKTSL